MKTVVLFSLTGGAGRTSVTGCLGSALSALGRRTLLVDADPQNALGLAFGLDVADRNGLARLEPSAVNGVVRRAGGGLAWLPFGHCTPDEALAIERAQYADASWLERRVVAAAPDDTEVTIVDPPAGVRPASVQALRMADVVIVVVRPDAGSYATLAAVDVLLGDLPRGPRKGLLLNGLDSRRALDGDVRAALELSFRDTLLPFTVPQDEAVREAFARQLPLRESAPDSQATAAFARLAGWVAETA